MLTMVKENGPLWQFKSAPHQNSPTVFAVGPFWFSMYVFSNDANTVFGDDMNQSIWTQEPILPAFPRLESDLNTDVLIIGGGMAGILCAHELHQSGVDYTLVEASTILQGVSGNTTAKITSQHGFIYHKLLRQLGPENAKLYWQANQEGLAQLQHLANGIDCDWECMPNHVYTLGNSALLEKEWHALQQLQIPAERYESLPLPFPVAGSICFPDQAQFHPLKFGAAIAKELHIYEHTAVRAFEGNTAITDSGKITANKIIVATHFPINNKHGLFFLKQYQQRSYVLALENPPQYPGMYLDVDEKGLSFRSYGNLLLLGGGSHRTGKEGGCWQELEQFAQIHYPQAHIVCRWATQDCITLDSIPYIGQYSFRTPNFFVATGFNKWGMTGSMTAATILSDLVRGRTNPYADLYAPSRSILQPQLFYNAAESAIHLLKPTTPRCPHLGCALKWNQAEHSWDCPCHGSRFSETGKLLDNPATGDLE